MFRLDQITRLSDYQIIKLDQIYLGARLRREGGICTESMGKRIQKFFEENHSEHYITHQIRFSSLCSW